MGLCVCVEREREREREGRERERERERETSSTHVMDTLDAIVKGRPPIALEVFKSSPLSIAGNNAFIYISIFNMLQ